MSCASDVLGSKQIVWQLLPIDNTFNCHTIASQSGRSVGVIRKILRDWEERKFVIRLDRSGTRGRLLYRRAITDKVPKEIAHLIEGPHGRQTIYGNMWRAMRTLKAFTPQDIAACGSTSLISVSIDDAAAYCRLLSKGQQPYLIAKKKAIPGKHAAQYRLVNNTGPKAPISRRVQGTFDPNIDTFTFIAGSSA